MPDFEELPDAEMFLKYDYPETKDMCFLTLITTVLVITVTFSDKIVDFSNASGISKWLVISSWTSFFIASPEGDATAKKGLGMSNIGNRTQAYRGKVQVLSAPGTGFELKIVFPLQKKRP